MRVLRPQRMTRRPLVSVVVPHYNYGQYLPAAVSSALDQRGIDLEVIVVDDKSTDGSAEVARRVAAGDERVTLIEHEQNMRHILTYNDGLSRARGDYVVLLSADDAVTPDSLTRSVALMEAHPRIGLVYGRVEWFDGDYPTFHRKRTWWQAWTGAEWIERVTGRGRNAIANPEVVMRRSIYDEIGGYDPEFPHAGDMFMWLQAAARADVGFVGGPTQAYYRNHGANMHSTTFGGVLDDMTQVRDVYERFFATDGRALRGATKLAERARRSVAREALVRAAGLVANGGEEGVLSAFQTFARETSPAVTSSFAWRWSALAATPVGARVVRAVENFRWKVRSRRTDVFGL